MSLVNPSLIELAARKLTLAKGKAMACLASTKSKLSTVRQLDNKVTKALSDCGITVVRPKELMESVTCYEEAEKFYASGTYIDYIASVDAAHRSDKLADQATIFLEAQFESKMQAAEQALTAQFTSLPSEQSRVTDATKFAFEEYSAGMREIKVAKERISEKLSSYEQAARRYQSIAIELRVWQHLLRSVDQERQKRYERSRQIEKAFKAIRTILPPTLFLIVIWYIFNSIEGCHEDNVKSAEVDSMFTGKWSFYGTINGNTDRWDVEFAPIDKYRFFHGSCRYTHGGSEKDLTWSVENAGRELVIYDYFGKSESHYDIIDIHTDYCRVHGKYLDVTWDGIKQPYTPYQYH